MGLTWGDNFATNYQLNILSFMPSKSKKQQKAAGIALSAKRGERKVESLKGSSRRMYENMNEGQLEDFASTKTKKLPNKK